MVSMTKRQAIRGFDDGPPGGGISDLCNLMWNHRRPERACAQCGKAEPKRLWLHPGRMFKIRKGAAHKVDLCSFACSAKWYAPKMVDGAVGVVWVARAHRTALEVHAVEHGYTDAEAAVFLARGGHGPSEQCSLVDWDADPGNDGSGEHVTPGPNRLRDTARLAERTDQVMRKKPPEIPCADRAHFGLPCGIGPDADPRRYTRRGPGCCTGCDWCIGKIPTCHGERCTCLAGRLDAMLQLLDWRGQEAELRNLLAEAAVALDGPSSAEQPRPEKKP